MAAKARLAALRTSHWGSPAASTAACKPARQGGGCNGPFEIKHCQIFKSPGESRLTCRSQQWRTRPLTTNRAMRPFPK